MVGKIIVDSLSIINNILDKHTLEISRDDLLRYVMVYGGTNSYYSTYSMYRLMLSLKFIVKKNKKDIYMMNKSKIKKFISELKTKEDYNEIESLCSAIEKKL